MTESTDRVRAKSMKPNQSIQEFIEEFERISAANQWDDATQAKVFPALLPSGSKYLQVINSLPAANQSFFSLVKAALYDSTKSSHIVNFHKLLSCKRTPNESASQYAQRIASLVERCYPEFPRANKATLVADFFFCGLPEEIRLQICGSGSIPSDVSKLITIVDAIECVTLFEKKRASK